MGTAPAICAENIEGYADYNIDPEAFNPLNRKSGVSAMMRIGDEKELIVPSILSILPFCDEVIVALQDSQDGTQDALKVFDNNPKVKVYEYPFKAYPNGPGHSDCKPGSVHEQSYFYNWTLSKTNHEYACYWDGDMVALDWVGQWVGQELHNYDMVRFPGINLVMLNPAMISKTAPSTGKEQRFFRVSNETVFLTNRCCASLAYPKSYREIKFNNFGFLHFKWAKSFESATKIWPDNWRDKAHFQRIFERRHPGAEYNGPIPDVVRGILN